MKSPETARRNMIDGQLRTNDVSHLGLLEAFEAVPREFFVPPGSHSTAYVDEAISLGSGRVMLEPLVLARLIQALELKACDHVLDIAAGTGYGAALLARLAASVIVVEDKLNLANTASANMHRLRLQNVAVVTSSLANGYAAQAPYDAILVEGGVKTIPESLFTQLAEGGRLAAVQMGRGLIGQATIWHKTGGVISCRTLFDAGVQLLQPFADTPAFVL